MAYGSGFPLPLQGAVPLGPQPRRELVPPVKFCGLHRGPRCRQRFVSDPIALWLRFNPSPALPAHRIAAAGMVCRLREEQWFRLLRVSPWRIRAPAVQCGSQQARAGTAP
jgi:hypothetical protein